MPVIALTVMLLLIVLAALNFVIRVIQFRRRAIFPANFEVRPHPIEDFPESPRQTASKYETDLVSVGYTRLGLCRMAGKAKHDFYFSYWIKGSVLAQITVSYNLVTAKSVARIAIGQYFDDGSQLIIRNSSPPIIEMPDTEVLCLPGIRQIPLFDEVARALLMLNGKDRTARIPSSAIEIATADARDAVDYYAKSGRFRLAAKRLRYRPTWRYAMSYVWQSYGFSKNQRLRRNWMELSQLLIQVGYGNLSTLKDMQKNAIKRVPGDSDNSETISA
jgi:hypothetical protein